MHIKFLGTGGAFDFEKGNAAAIVEVAGKNILIDCGFSTLPRLVELDLAKTIDYILVTHLHADHVGSLPALLPYCKYRLEKEIPSIIIPNAAFQQETLDFLKVTYENERAHFVPISDFPEIGYIDTSNQHKPGMTSFAYYFSEKNSLIYYSGDIGNADVAANFLKDRTESVIKVFHETSPMIDGIAHASYKEVEEKLGKYNPYVYHIAKENMPDDCMLKYVEDHPEFLFS